MDQQSIRKNEQAIENNQKVEKAVKEQAKLLVKMGCLSKSDADYFTRNWLLMIPSWQSRQYQNAVSLLEHYRSLRWKISDNITDVAEESGLKVHGDLLYDNVHALLREISDAQGCEQNITRLESVVRSAELSIKMLEYADYALERVHTYPDGGDEMFNVLYHTYVCEETVLEQKEKKQPFYKLLSMGKSTYYDIRRRGMKLFSECIWGLPKMDIQDYVLFCMLIEKKHGFSK